MKSFTTAHLILTLTVVFFNCACFGQTTAGKKLNLDFEEVSSLDKTLPAEWKKWGPATDYNIRLDSVTAQSGRRCLQISSKGDNAFGSLVTNVKVPKTPGTLVTLEGYIKTTNVSGFAGLVLRIDGGGKVLAFDNMKGHGPAGTSDWKKYSVTLELGEDAEVIRVAAMLEGMGEAWFDSFAVYVDGKRLIE